MSAIPHHTSDLACPLCSAKLALAHPELAQWFSDIVKPLHADSHVAWSYRGPEDQEQAFKEGKSKCHYPDSPHNKKPAEALDLFQIDAAGRGIWVPKFFAALDAHNKAQGIDLLWGGEFKSLGDYDHFQIRRP